MNYVRPATPVYLVWAKRGVQPRQLDSFPPRPVIFYSYPKNHSEPAPIFI